MSGLRRPRIRDQRRQGQGDPDFTKRSPLPFARMVVTDELRREMRAPAGLPVRVYRLGDCSVIVTIHSGVHHLSIAHPTRYPTWDEIAEARYRCLPDGIDAALWLPSRADYVNVHPNCFQLVQGERPAHLRDQSKAEGDAR